MTFVVGHLCRSFLQALDQRRGSAGGDGCRYSLRVSMAEIYMEQVYDLIRFDKKQLQVGPILGCGVAEFKFV